MPCCKQGTAVPMVNVTGLAVAVGALDTSTDVALMTVTMNVDAGMEPPEIGRPASVPANRGADVVTMGSPAVVAPVAVVQEHGLDAPSSSMPSRTPAVLSVVPGVKEPSL